MRNDGYIDYEAIQRRVTERVQRRYRFFFHSAVFLVGIPLIGSWAAPQLFLLWIGGWVAHLLYYNYQNNLEAAIDDEIEREHDRAMKRKRDQIDIMERYGDLDSPDAAQEVIVEEVADPYKHGNRPAWLGDDGELRIHDDTYYEQ